MVKNRCENIGKYISQIYRKGGTYITKSLCKEGIGSGQLMFLMELYRRDGIIQEDLAESLNIDKGTTARALKKLEEENLVIRTKNEQDKRAYNVFLTDRGKKLKSYVYGVFDEWENIMTESLSSEEKEIIVTLLKKISIRVNMKDED